ncbi:HAD family hydrolase [Paenibacillus eucommiae]|uniref:Hydroxymethylpyrimidine pyrophosphatase-like HAD family hydrolase n=1 Tax=Paenibacillus eucommiae TaxID=1355755 RepID=A0ABS4J8U2_9BACL|nr:HAD hydrolase family protein [Paenibacillus eucommiae]MBP1996261.1 hydroxymethylpyrimidine pyrophosphatase-like HAD family hydrolase [Paenibacillus eucommiae]
MSKIQAIVLDLDGTLLGSDKSISPRNYQAVKKCFDSGIHIIIATARPPRAANQFLMKGIKRYRSEIRKCNGIRG